MRAIPLVLALVVCGLLAPSAGQATPLVLQPGTVTLGTTDESQSPTIPGGEVFGTLVEHSALSFDLTLDVAFAVGSAIVLNPDETSLFDVRARLTADPVSSVLVGFDLQFTLSGLTLSLEGGELLSIFLLHDFGANPLAVSLPDTVVSVNALALAGGTGELRLPIDAEIPVPGYPSAGTANLVLAGELVFRQVPEPAGLVALAFGALALVARRRSGRLWR